MKLISSGCPKCKVLMKKLEGLDYELIEDDDAIKFAEENGFREMPLLVKDDGAIITFTEAVKYLKG